MSKSLQNYRSVIGCGPVNLDQFKKIIIIIKLQWNQLSSRSMPYLHKNEIKREIDNHALFK